MDQPYHCNKDRPNGTAGGVSLRKGAFLQEHLTASRRKQPAFNPFMESYPMKQYPPHYIDQYARKIFPLLFGLFNIVYWSYYLPRRWSSTTSKRGLSDDGFDVRNGTGGVKKGNIKELKDEEKASAAVLKSSVNPGLNFLKLPCNTLNIRHTWHIYQCYPRG